MRKPKEYVSRKCFDLVNPGAKGSRKPGSITSYGGRKRYPRSFYLLSHRSGLFTWQYGVNRTWVCKPGEKGPLYSWSSYRILCQFSIEWARSAENVKLDHFQAWIRGQRPRYVYHQNIKRLCFNTQTSLTKPRSEVDKTNNWLGDITY